MSELNFDLLDHLADAPPSQLDEKLSAHLKSLRGKSDKEVADGILYVLDHGARYGLASGLVMRALHVEWTRLGGTVEADNANCPWRNDTGGV